MDWTMGDRASGVKLAAPSRRAERLVNCSNNPTDRSVCTSNSEWAATLNTASVHRSFTLPNRGGACFHSSLVDEPFRDLGTAPSLILVFCCAGLLVVAASRPLAEQSGSHQHNPPFPFPSLFRLREPVLSFQTNPGQRGKRISRMERKTTICPDELLGSAPPGRRVKERCRLSRCSVAGHSPGCPRDERSDGCWSS